jgi:hypothetical protein
MKLIALFFVILSFQAHAGGMKEIDLITRETVANAYYTGHDQDEYYDYMDQEIWGVNLEAGIEGKCLVTVTGMATTYTETIGINKFWVCINKLSNGKFVGYLLKDEIIE